MEDLAEWLFGNWQLTGYVFASTLMIYIVVSACVRLVGLRSFSKMSTTDFVTTVAIGSLMAGIISAPSPSIVIGTAALLSIFALKWSIAIFRRRSDIAPKLLDNQPVYLMRGANIRHANLKACAVSVEELHSKLREANVWHYDQIICVTLETTGDVAVLSRQIDSTEMSEEIFADVRDSSEAEPLKLKQT